MQPARLDAGVVFCAALLGTLVLAPSSSAQTVEPSQQLNDRIRARSSARTSPAPHDYVIGSGDLVSVQVFDVPELSRELRVSQIGTIGIPLIPVRLHISGLTEAQAEVKIAEVLEANGLVSHPEVSVSVKEKKSKPITIVGAVARPMVYQADRQVTLIEVLAEAGGILNDAADTVIISRLETDPTLASSEPPPISAEDAGPPASQTTSLPAATPSAPAAVASRGTPAAGPVGPNSTQDSAARTALRASSSKSLPTGDAPEPVPPPLTNTITVNLNRVLESGDTSGNIVLQAGDVVTVPHAGIVYALGAVSRPGGFLVSNDRSQLTTLKLLSLAGGLDRSARPGRTVIVRRDGDGRQHEVQVDLKKIMRFEAEDVRLMPSDILYVPKSTTKQALIRTGELSLAIGTGLAIYRLIP
jgi:polysaccharide biosynthesis/export protein